VNPCRVAGGARTPNVSGCADNPPSQQPGGGSSVSLAFEQLHFCHCSFHRPGRPAERQSIHDGGTIALDTVAEADEWTKFTGGRVIQPPVQLTYTAPRDQATESLQQFISTSQPFIFIENPLECIALGLIELIRWTEAQPTHVHPLDALPTPTTPSAWFRRWTWPSPRLNRLHQQ
jgi:hypothetical protein